MIFQTSERRIVCHQRVNIPLFSQSFQIAAGGLQMHSWFFFFFFVCAWTTRTFFFSFARRRLMHFILLLCARTLEEKEWKIWGRHPLDSDADAISWRIIPSQRIGGRCWAEFVQKL